MFAGFGLFFVAWSFAHYKMDTAVRMGPGYFPAVLGGLLVVLGAVIFLQSFAFDGPKVEAFHFKPLIFVSVSVIAYGYLIQPGGLAVPAAPMHKPAMTRHPAAYQRLPTGSPLAVTPPTALKYAGNAVSQSPVSTARYIPA